MSRHDSIKFSILCLFVYQVLLCKDKQVTGFVNVVVGLCPHVLFIIFSLNLPSYMCCTVFVVSVSPSGHAPEAHK